MTGSPTLLGDILGRLVRRSLIEQTVFAHLSNIHPEVTMRSPLTPTSTLFRIRVRFVMLATWVFPVASLMLGAMPLPVYAGCTSTSQCPSHMVCMNTAIPGIKECKQQMCNADSECPSARPRCLNGACMAPAGTGGGTSNSGSGGSGGSTGGTLGDVGQTCGPYKIGQVTKSRGCKQGLQCMNGRCQPLAR